MTSMNSLKDNCALIINSCDAYEDIWPLFFAAFKENWPGCDLEIYLNTESKTFKFDGLNLVSFNKDHIVKGVPWGKRLIELQKRIDKPFIVSLFDDFILEGPVDVETLKECLNLMLKDKDISAFYFLAIPGAERSDGIHQKFNFLENFTDYKINSAPAIWRKSSLIKYTGENDNPWAWEVFGTARTYFEKDRFYSLRNNDQMIFKYNYALGGAIRRGKWVSSVVVPLLEKYQLHVDLNKRGIAGECLSEGRHSIKWKLQFLMLGYQMVGARSVVFTLRAIGQKLIRAIR